MASVSSPAFDCTIVGASFGGLSCAMSLAEAGLATKVLERKTDPGAGLHTTGILVREAMDGVPWLSELPSDMVRRIDGVRLYAPGMHSVALSAPGYYFLATDTPQVMRWMTERCCKLGTDVRLGATYTNAQRDCDGFCVEGFGRTSYLVGADGPKSRVARDLGLGENKKFLFGVEYEYENLELAEPNLLHCFIDRRLAPGYIGWVVAGVGIVQIGLARRAAAPGAAKEAIAAFIEKIVPVIDARRARPAHIRAGYIPCGGLVDPVAAERALLVGDSAGMVSPVTAGGIHTAISMGKPPAAQSPPSPPANATTRAGGSSIPIPDFVQNEFCAGSSSISRAIWRSMFSSAPRRCGRRRGWSFFTACGLSGENTKTVIASEANHSHPSGIATPDGLLRRLAPRK